MIANHADNIFSWNDFYIFLSSNCLWQFSVQTYGDSTGFASTERPAAAKQRPPPGVQVLDWATEATEATFSWTMDPTSLS
jgi:hypothetical protein